MAGLEFIVQALGEGLIHPFLKSIGALLRWPFYLENTVLKKSIKNLGTQGLGGLY